MATPSRTPAGWYPSPCRDGHLRYWDGQQWTTDEKPEEPAQPEEPADLATTSTPTLPPGWYPIHATPGIERWWDGAQWREQTRPAAPAFPMSPAPGYVMYGAAPAPRTDGKLIAAGVITIVQAALLLLAALLTLTLAQSEIGRLADDISGGVVTFIGLFLLGVGATVLIAGINTCRGRNWARILVIVLQSIFILLTVASLTDPDAVGGAVIGLAICAAALILAALGTPRSASRT